MKNRKLFGSTFSILNSKFFISNERGFTLIEVLLASFIFMSVVTIAVGSFTNQITLQSTSEAQRAVQQTGQSIIEAVVRDLRTHSEEFDIQGVSCRATVRFGDECGNRLVVGSGMTAKTYRLASRRLTLDNQALHDDQINITTFRVEGVEPNVNNRTNQSVQPFVVITLSLQTPNSANPALTQELTLRTMVTSRLFDKYRLWSNKDQL